VSKVYDVNNKSSLKHDISDLSFLFKSSYGNVDKPVPTSLSKMSIFKDEKFIIIIIIIIMISPFYSFLMTFEEICHKLWVDHYLTFYLRLSLVI
jgi:hypothetical protein